MARNFEPKAAAFVRTPKGTWVLGHGTSTWSTSRRLGQPSFYAPDFFLKDAKPWLSFENFEVLTDEQWRALWGKTQPPRLSLMDPDRDSFLERTEQLLGHIHAGRLQKAVPVVFERGTGAGICWADLLSGLPTSENLYAYGFWTESEGLLGATPEIFLERQGRELKTMALAGTGTLTAPSLLENSKERHEHQLVIDDIARRLGEVGQVVVGRTAELKLPTLKHLHTPIQANLHKAATVEEMVACLHPTPALGGSPRDAALDWLTSQPEALERRRFGAPFGFADDESAFLVVAIRNLQYHSDQIWLGSGCGVVEGSIPEREWDELKLKRDSVRRQLGLL